MNDSWEEEQKLYNEEEEQKLFDEIVDDGFFRELTRVIIDLFKQNSFSIENIDREGNFPKIDLIHLPSDKKFTFYPRNSILDIVFIDRDAENLEVDRNLLKSKTYRRKAMEDCIQQRLNLMIQVAAAMGDEGKMRGVAKNLVDEKKLERVKIWSSANLDGLSTEKVIEKMQTEDPIIWEGEGKPE